MMLCPRAGYGQPGSYGWNGYGGKGKKGKGRGKGGFKGGYSGDKGKGKGYKGEGGKDSDDKLLSREQEIKSTLSHQRVSVASPCDCFAGGRQRHACGIQRVRRRLPEIALEATARPSVIRSAFKTSSVGPARGSLVVQPCMTSIHPSAPGAKPELGQSSGECQRARRPTSRSAGPPPLTMRPSPSPRTCFQGAFAQGYEKRRVARMESDAGRFGRFLCNLEASAPSRVLRPPPSTLPLE